MLPMGAFVIGGLMILHFRPQSTETRPPRFYVPSSDKVAINAKVDGSCCSKQKSQYMTLDPNRKYLINSITMKPVFVVGDSSWSLQVQLSDNDIELYLHDRAARGFNAIWVGLADNTYSNSPPHDFYGNVPFNGPDFTNENPAYWTRVDHTMWLASADGITVFASPAFVGYGCKEGYCESYRRTPTEVVNAYGRFLGNRYKEFPNIVWVIGGDADPADSNVQSKLYALAQGIRSADASHLITTENYRGSSSEDIWAEASWLDINGVYMTPNDIPAKANRDYLASKHPLLMFEDWYEGEHSVTELEVRKEGYWAVLSGCTLGRFFGNGSIWNFNWPAQPSPAWKTQLSSAGSVGQARLGSLFRSRQHWKLVPDIDHSVMTAGYDSRSLFRSAKETSRSTAYRQTFRSDNMLSVAARTSDGQTIIAYVPSGSASKIDIDMTKITDSKQKTKCWWFNPRDGSTLLIGIFPAAGTRTFTAPDSSDWVLVVDSQDANLAPPGRGIL